MQTLACSSYLTRPTVPLRDHKTRRDSPYACETFQDVAGRWAYMILESGLAVVTGGNEASHIHAILKARAKIRELEARLDL